MSSFIQFAAERGLVIEHLSARRWVRVRTVDKPRKRNGSYYYDGDYAHVQNWSQMDHCDTWFRDKETKSDPDMVRRMEESKALADRRRVEDALRASQKAEDIISKALPYSHPYLVSKGLPEALGLILGDTLIVPMYDLREKLVGAQTIEMVDGVFEKKMLFGTRAKGAVHRIGKRAEKKVLCEGFSTGLSLRAAVDLLHIPAEVVVCFSAGNIPTVAKHIGGRSMVCADNDASQTGQNAAIATGLPWCMPEVEGEDFNDLHQKHGLFAVVKRIKDILRVI